MFSYAKRNYADSICTSSTVIPITVTNRMQKNGLYFETRCLQYNKSVGRMRINHNRCISFFRVSDCVHTIPAQFENGRKVDNKNSLQDFNAQKKYSHPKNRPALIQKRRKMCCLHHCRVFTRYCFKFIPVRVPFSKSTVFEICRQKMCGFRVNGRPIRHIFHPFQNVPASCERGPS